MTADAAPLPDAEIRACFPDAPEDVSVPTDVSALFTARLRGMWEQHKVLLIAVDAVALVVAIAAFSAGALIVTCMIAAAWVLATIVVLFVQHGRARSDFFSAYARARGLSFAGASKAVPTRAVPLMRKGDKRTCEQAMTGTVHGVPATLANYTYTEVTTDSEGRRSESDHDYLVLHLQLPPQVAARFAGVYLAPKGWSFGALQDKLSHDRAVQLESADFLKRYSLRVADAQDDVALYELFHPAFIDALTTGPQVTWEQVGADIVFYRKRHETEAADLDRFVASALPVVTRYREEFR